MRGPQQGSLHAVGPSNWDTPIWGTRIGPLRRSNGVLPIRRLAVTLQSLRLCTNTALGAAVQLASEVAAVLLGKLPLVLPSLVACSCSWCRRCGVAISSAFHCSCSCSLSASCSCSCPCSLMAWFASKCRSSMNDKQS